MVSQSDVDQLTAPVQEAEPWPWRFALGVCVLIFNGVLIWWCVLYGRSENLLHQNALTWAFLAALATLAGLGFGAAIPVLSQLRGK